MFKLFFSRPKAVLEKPGRKNIKLVLGLGNPGGKYAKTYHNAGRLYVERAAKGPFKKYRHFEFSKENGLIFARSFTYMNESGIAAREALRYFNLKPQNLLVAHDESDLPLGKYKISFGQSAAGHNGVQSVIDHLGTKDFFRLKIGIRENQRGKAEEFVLKPMPKRKLDILGKVFSDIEVL